MGRTGYPAEFPSKVLDVLAEGRAVASVAHDLDVSEQTISNWRRQDRIDRSDAESLPPKLADHYLALSARGLL